jgi:integrase/recombinase XerC
MSSAPKWLNRIEQNALLRHIEQIASIRDITIIKVLMNTGLRVQELCDLKWSDIVIAERKGNLTVRNRKGEKYREIPLNKESRNAFNAIDYKQHVGSDRPVFLGQRGSLTPRGVQLMFKRLINNSKLDDISPHQLRHTFCKNLVDAGVSLEKVATLAGHERLDTTKIYCKPSQADLSDAVELIGEEE